MRRLWHAILHEVKEAVFPCLFFLVAFEVGLITKALLLHGTGVTLAGLSIAAVAAATVTKAILIADGAAFANIFSGKPLVFRILWKTLIFGGLTLLFRFLEELIHLWVGAGQLASAFKELLGDFSWPHFWVIQIWLTLALLLFTTIIALDRYLGEGRLRRILFG